MISHSLYHKSLRVSAVLVASVLVFQSGLFIPGTALLSLSARHYVANVIGISASVETTEISALTAELTRRGQELDQRESALTAREIDAQARDVGTSFDASDYLLSAILLLLLLLITANYFFDFMRERARKHTQYAAMG